MQNNIEHSQTFWRIIGHDDHLGGAPVERCRPVVLVDVDTLVQGSEGFSESQFHVRNKIRHLSGDVVISIDPIDSGGDGLIIIELERKFIHHDRGAGFYARNPPHELPEQIALHVPLPSEFGGITYLLAGA